MDPQTSLFQQHRSRLFGLAYRMLGTPGDAEDVLHDAWLRWHAQDTSKLDDAEAWLVTVTTRLALDRLRRVKTEREHYRDHGYLNRCCPMPTNPKRSWNGQKASLSASCCCWSGSEAVKNSNAVARASLGVRDKVRCRHGRLAALAVAGRFFSQPLSADERAAFLLREVFDHSHAETTAILDIGEDACRQRVHRAKQRLRDERPRQSTPDTGKQYRLLERFAEALRQPDLDTLRALFAEDAVHISDGGGLVTATLHPLYGAERLARLYLQMALHQQADGVRHEIHPLNGTPVLFSWLGDTLISASWIDEDDAGISAIHALRHPEKLARLAAATKSAGSASLH